MPQQNLRDLQPMTVPDAGRVVVPQLMRMPMMRFPPLLNRGAFLRGCNTQVITHRHRLSVWEHGRFQFGRKRKRHLTRPCNSPCITGSFVTSAQFAGRTVLGVFSGLVTLILWGLALGVQFGIALSFGFLG